MGNPVVLQSNNWSRADRSAPVLQLLHSLIGVELTGAGRGNRQPNLQQGHKLAEISAALGWPPDGKPVGLLGAVIDGVPAIEVGTLMLAETNNEAAAAARQELDTRPALLRRRVLANYAALVTPGRPRRRARQSKGRSPT